MASSPPSDPKREETRVDLGDDLLEATRTIATPIGESDQKKTKETNPERASQEELQNAQILIGEGLWDQAKEALHRSLRHHSENRLARALLEDIQKRELENLLAHPGSGKPIHAVEEDISEVLLKLEEDWRIGLDVGETQRLSLLGSQEAHQQFAQCIAQQASTFSARERADLAVGFLQMELPEISLGLLKPTISDSGHAALYCWALLQAGREYDCIAILDSHLREEGIREEVRREMEYLLARSRERLGEVSIAIELYRELNDYRDSDTRLQRLQSQGRSR